MGIIASRKLGRLRKKTQRTRDRLVKRANRRKNTADDKRDPVMKAVQEKYTPLGTEQQSSRRTLDERFNDYTTRELLVYEPIELAAVAPFDGDYETGQLDLGLEEDFGLSIFPALHEDIFTEIGTGENQFPIAI